MYKIGEFSKLVDISVRTLRYYDEYGLLKPEYTDTFSGYRYYTDDNIVEAEIIKLLKNLDFSLEEIYLYKNNLTPDIIKNKIDELQRQMYLLELKCQRLDILRDNLSNGKTILYTNDSDVKVLRKLNEEGIRKAS